MGDLADHDALHPTQAVIKDRQPVFAEFVGGGVKASANALLRLEKHSSQIFLISRQHVERKLARALDHAVAGAVGPHRHHHQWRLKRALGNPAGRKAIDHIAFGHAADERAVGDLAQQHLLGVSVEAHGRGTISFDPGSSS